MRGISFYSSSSVIDTPHCNENPPSLLGVCSSSLEPWKFSSNRKLSLETFSTRTYRWQNGKEAARLENRTKQSSPINPRSIAVEWCLNDTYLKLDCSPIVTRANTAFHSATGCLEKIEKNARRRETVARWMRNGHAATCLKSMYQQSVSGNGSADRERWLNSSRCLYANDANWKGEGSQPEVRFALSVADWFLVVVGLTNSLTITLFERGGGEFVAARHPDDSAPTPLYFPRQTSTSAFALLLRLVLLDNLAICKIASPGWSRIWRHRVLRHTYFYSTRLCQAARAGADPAGEKSIRLKSLPTIGESRGLIEFYLVFRTRWLFYLNVPCFNNPGVL